MGSVRIDVDKVNEAKAAAKALEQSIEQTYESCEQLISYLHSAKWSGKSRDSFLSYLEIIQKYHYDMKSAVAKQTKALNNLDGYIDDFLQDGSVREVKNL
ncbi:WXG100 family type VII secretion target [Neobacillus sp. SuZ13]|uniref:WXG100 family type VII secretion target n=1 Tax=Neobacillus sp. SuZ13 TaxID=3047875 RepID=UPI0024BF835D|nr:WXG100 family type VII secretion target [Neobacillus sp. SuZ13]WHY67414.1 WXG100 family type VII secretion target [Neobacillus sp. SuZ13]